MSVASGVMAVTLAMGVSASCLGQDDAAPGPNTGSLHFEIGGEWTNAYYFRGLLQEDDGFIFQNWIDIGVDLTEGDNWALSANFGIWNSVHDDTSTAGSMDEFVEHLYETDLYAGLGLEVEAWTFGATYVVYTSPSDAFSTIGELILSIGFDDSEIWGGAFALNPHAAVAFEVDDTGGTEDSYLEFGIAPGCSHEIGDTTLDLEFPVTVGLGLDDYYIDAGGDDEFFGFLEAGVDASMPLGVPARFGSWSLNGGVHVLLLGDAAEDANNGDDVEIVGRFGVAIGY